VIQVGLGLAVALLLHGRVPGRSVIRALMLLPLMIPPVITALMWKIMMASTDAGILNHMLSFLGVDPINWFRLHARGRRLGPYHRYLGQPAVRVLDPARRAASLPTEPTRRPGSTAPAPSPSCATSRCRS